jgi:hypothetical protein
MATLGRIRSFAPTAAKLADSKGEYLSVIKARRQEEAAARKEREVRLAQAAWTSINCNGHVLLWRRRCMLQGLHCRGLWNPCYAVFAAACSQHSPAMADVGSRPMILQPLTTVVG